jgi:hypothetical protein
MLGDRSALKCTFIASTEFEYERARWVTRSEEGYEEGERGSMIEPHLNQYSISAEYKGRLRYFGTS